MDISWSRKAGVGQFIRKEGSCSVFEFGVSLVNSNSSSSKRTYIWEGFPSCLTRHISTDFTSYKVKIKQMVHILFFCPINTSNNGVERVQRKACAQGEIRLEK